MSWQYLAVATEAALRAGRIQRERYGSGFAIEMKGELDLVTEVDHACELAILEAIRSRYPGHDIVTEETDLARTGSHHVWYVDPLDGTTNFAHGYPMFCVSIALAFEGEIVAGAVFDPLRDELFTAEKGGGAHLNGRPLRVSTAATLIESLLITGFPYDLHEKLEERLRPFNRLWARRARSAATAPRLSTCATSRRRGPTASGKRSSSRGTCTPAGSSSPRPAGGRPGSTARRSASAPTGIVATNGHIHDELVAVLREEEATALV